MIRSTLFAALSLVALTGCATALGFGPPSFPPRERIDEIAQRPPPAVPAPPTRVAVDTWTLAGPFPERVGDAPMKAGDAVADVVLATVGAERTSENLACAAREIGRFVLQHKEGADVRLQRYLALRCGAATSNVGYRSLTSAKVGADVTDAALVAQGRDDVASMLKKVPSDERIGAALVRDPQSSSAILLIAYARSEVAVKAAPQSQGVVEGTIAATGNFESTFAYVTQGSAGAAECTRDSTVALPAFRFTCPVAADDATAMIEVFGREHDHILARPIADVLVVAKPDAAATWRRVDYASSSTSTAGGDVAASALALINAARANVGAPALVEAAAQSATVTKLAPHYFAAALAEKPDDDVTDLIALGALAGYDVKDIVIHDAAFTSLVDRAGDVVETIDEAFDRPSIRFMLFSKKATHAAIGASSIGGKRSGLLVVGYEPMAPLDAKAAALAVIAKLDEQRRQRGAPETGAITPVADIMAKAGERLTAGDDVEVVGKETLNASVAKMSRGLGLWTLEAYDVDHLTFPEGLLTSKMTYVSVAVANRKRKNAAWGSTEILILYATEQNTRSAE